MSIDRFVIAFAGFVVLLSTTLTYLHSPLWLFLAAVAGFNMMLLSFTGFCPLVIFLKKIGFKPGPVSR